MKTRYRSEVADVFLFEVKAAENRLRDAEIGTPAPYRLAGHNVVLRELYFKSGPADYCIIFTVSGENVGLITLWHGRGSRQSDKLIRIWDKN